MVTRSGPFDIWLSRTIASMTDDPAARGEAPAAVALWRPMRPRSPHESHRVATPLELFFDLVFVVAVAQAASALHHAVADAHAVQGIVGYAMALLISVLILWIFGRTDGVGREELIQAVVVVAFPASLGAGAARLIL